MAEAQNSLEDFLSSLAGEKANNMQSKELELARNKNKLRKGKAKERTQKHRVRQMVASLQATREENDRLKSEILRLQTEMMSLDDGMD